MFFISAKIQNNFDFLLFLPISPMLTIASPPLKGDGGMFIFANGQIDKFTNRQIC